MVTDIRRRVLDEALTSFLSEGYERTTIAQIRERCGVSNGALFHHFSSKEAIADALYIEAMSAFQAGLWDLVRRKPRSLRAAVRGTIVHLFEWVEDNADLARFVYMRGHLEWGSSGAAEIDALNRDLADAFEEWLQPLVQRNEVRPTSMLMISAIVTGPAHAIARRWLTGGLEASLTTFIPELVDSACAALTGTPVRTTRGAEPRPTRGRVLLELVDADGTVLATGRADANLVPAGAFPEARP